MGLFSRKDKSDKSNDGSAKTAEETGAKAASVKGEEAKAGKSMKELYSEAESKASASAKDEKGGKRSRTYGNAFKILIKPLITEKSANLSSENKYVFAVSAKANKVEISKAVEEVYGIKPRGVNIVNVKGKKVKYGRTSGVRKNWRKAIVALPEGKTINIYEGV